MKVLGKFLFDLKNSTCETIALTSSTSLRGQKRCCSGRSVASKRSAESGALNAISRVPGIGSPQARSGIQLNSRSGPEIGDAPLRHLLLLRLHSLQTHNHRHRTDGTEQRYRWSANLARAGASARREICYSSLVWESGQSLFLFSSGTGWTSSARCRSAPWPCRTPRRRCARRGPCPPR